MSKPEQPKEPPEKSGPENEQSVNELTAEELERVAGGAKHVAGVKYEDVTVICGTGMTKVDPGLPKASS